MSPAARKRISDAMRRRWAKWKGKSAPKKNARPGDECCGQEEVVGLDESSLGCEEEVSLALFLSAKHSLTRTDA